MTHKYLQLACLVALVLFFVLAEVNGALPKPKKTPKATNAGGKSVKQRGLVSTSVTWDSIVNENSQYDTKMANSPNFKGDTLAYVTPWNGKGYDIAKTFRGKFTYISPVWYQIKFTREGKEGDENPKQSYTLAGQHDVDRDWLNELTRPFTPEEKKRLSPKQPKIVPRFLFEGISSEALFAWVMDASNSFPAVAQLIADEVKKENYDGVTLDFGFMQFAMVRDALVEFFTVLSSLLGEKEILLPVPPMVGEQAFFTTEDFEAFSPFISRFQIMTYDYSQHSTKLIGSAPLTWVRRNILSLIPPNQRGTSSKKLMIGLNMYGMEFSRSGISPKLGNDLLEKLRDIKPRIEWNDSINEHVFMGGEGEQTIYMFPTLQYIQDRLELAEEMGVGCGLWEIGQGLDYFYDLF